MTRDELQALAGEVLGDHPHEVVQEQDAYCEVRAFERVSGQGFVLKHPASGSPGASQDGARAKLLVIRNAIVARAAQERGDDAEVLKREGHA